jgi:uncharacterized membrane-anchored protein
MQIRRAVRPPLPVAALTAFLMATVFAGHAFAYIDPGTYQTVWTGLAPMVSILVGCAAVLLVPFWFVVRRVRALWNSRIKGKKE